MDHGYGGTSFLEVSMLHSKLFNRIDTLCIQKYSFYIIWFFSVTIYIQKNQARVRISDKICLGYKYPSIVEIKKRHDIRSEIVVSLSEPCILNTVHKPPHINTYIDIEHTASKNARFNIACVVVAIVL